MLFEHGVKLNTTENNLEFLHDITWEALWPGLIILLITLFAKTMYMATTWKKNSRHHFV